MPTAARGPRTSRSASTPTTAPSTPSTGCRSSSGGRGARRRRRVGLRQERDGALDPRPAAATATVTGSVRFDGADLLGASARPAQAIRGREIAYVFQEPMTSLNPVLTHRPPDRRGAARAHEPVAERAPRRESSSCSTSSASRTPSRRIDEYPHQLSGGMRQRVMIAMALACDPKILIADEPTTALDVTIQAGILDLLRELRERLGTAIVLITHDLGVVADLADRVVVMYAGRKAEEAAGRRAVRAPAAPVHDRPARRRSARRRGAQRAPAGDPRSCSLARRASGPCAFADRCPRADEQSWSSVPELRLVRPDHVVACFHPGER